MAAQQQQQAFVGGFPVQPSLPSYPPQLQASVPYQQPPVPGLAAPAHLPCISGPPAYVHINGQTYVPVDSPQPSVAKPASLQPAVEAAPEPAPRALSDEEIDRRVYQQVEAWAARQRKPAGYQPAETAASGDYGRKHLKGRAVSDEDRAAERVSSVNAGMRGGRFTSPF